MSSKIWPVGACMLVLAALASGSAHAAPLQSWAVRQYDATLRDVTFRGSTTGFAVGDRGTIMRTADGGHTWLLQRSGVGVSLGDVSFASDTLGYAAGDAGTILRTTDGGGNWAVQPWDGSPTYPQVQSSDVNLRGVDFSSPGHGIAVGCLGTALRTVIGRGGFQSWQMAVTPHGYCLNAVDMVDDNLAYAVGNNGDIVYTTDAGASWHNVTWQLRRGQTVPTLYDVSFSDAGTGWAVGSGGAIVLIDGATKVAQLVGSPTANDLYGVRVIAGIGFAVGSGGTVLERLNGAWQTVPEGVDQDLHGVYFSGLEPVVAVGNHGLVTGTDTVGFDLNWAVRIPPAFGDYVLSAVGVTSTGDPVVEANDVTDVYVGAFDTWATTKGPASGQVLEDGLPVWSGFDGLFAVDFANSIGLAVGGPTVLRSFGGSTWDPVTSPSTSLDALAVVADASGAAAWVAGQQGGVYRSTDYFQAQMSFQNMSIGTTKNIRALSFLMPGLGFAAANDGSIWVMIDGNLWTAHGSVGAPVTDLVYVDSLDGWASGPKGIFSTSGGWPWQAETPEIPVNGIAFGAGKGWAVGDHSLLLEHVS